MCGHFGVGAAACRAASWSGAPSEHCPDGHAFFLSLAFDVTLDLEIASVYLLPVRASPVPSVVPGSLVVKTAFPPAGASDAKKSTRRCDSRADTLRAAAAAVLAVLTAAAVAGGLGVSAAASPQPRIARCGRVCAIAGPRRWRAGGGVAHASRPSIVFSLSDGASGALSMMLRSSLRLTSRVPAASQRLARPSLLARRGLATKFSKARAARFWRLHPHVCRALTQTVCRRTTNG